MSDAEIRKPGQPPQSWSAAQSVRPHPDVGEAPRPRDDARGAALPYPTPPEGALRPIGRVKAGRYSVHVSASRTARPAVQLRLDCETFRKPLVFYATSGEVGELIGLLEQARAELGGPK